MTGQEPTVEMLTAGEIKARRSELLRRAGLSETELRSRSRDYSLTEAQVALLEQLDDLDFLLGQEGA